MHTEEPGIWQENCPKRKMRHKHCMTWNMARNPEKREKMRNVHGRTWNMVRKLTNEEKETDTLYGPGIWQEN
jgi:hypothetical protein